jgi:hypothetical protein
MLLTANNNTMLSVTPRAAAQWLLLRAAPQPATASGIPVLGLNIHATFSCWTYPTRSRCFNHHIMAGNVITLLHCVVLQLQK